MKHGVEYMESIHPFSKPLVLCRRHRDALAYPSIFTSRQGTTLDIWPVHHRAHTRTHLFTLTPKGCLPLICPACLWIEEETRGPRGHPRQYSCVKQMVYFHTFNLSLFVTCFIYSEQKRALDCSVSQ